ncbi:20530_t:CDS:2 [Racocetra persica]|uniref:20530_t:CDS:1 n=1 Tax=Racocetra persica TaxID=160502 RepID=A0ACA9MVS8_9GLOM|nr:20530_t:CDS:2 [Racocetra persica]
MPGETGAESSKLINLKSEIWFSLSATYMAKCDLWVTFFARVDKTKLCLQTSLVSLYENDSSTCSEIRDKALGSHANCYVESGVCVLPPSDWVSIFKTIDFRDLFGTLPPVKFFDVSIIIFPERHGIPQNVPERPETHWNATK